MDFRTMINAKPPRAVSRAVSAYARMWPREIFDHIAATGESKNRSLGRSIDFLKQPGVYVLYRDDVPYYVGKAARLRVRLRAHALNPEARYYNFWNFFSAFVVLEVTQRNEVESILISAMPTANSAQPKLPKEKFPKEVRAMVRKIRREHANPLPVKRGK